MKEKDFMGPTLFMIGNIFDPHECWLKCQQTPNCVGMTLILIYGHCHIKQKIDYIKHDPNAMSAPRTCIEK